MVALGIAYVVDSQKQYKYLLIIYLRGVIALFFCKKVVFWVDYLAKKMIGKLKKEVQLDLFKVQLDRLINKSHELYQLVLEVCWAGLEIGLEDYYSINGRPSIPIRTMVGMLYLKNMFNQSDESVVVRWTENPYCQYFTGEQYFQNIQPFDPSEFVYFRKRMGQEGGEDHELHSRNTSRCLDREGSTDRLDGSTQEYYFSNRFKVSEENNR
ncbi:MAG: hypothetical protein ACJATI_004376 [Halioglobus sp.]